MKYNETIISKKEWGQLFDYTYLKDGKPDMGKIKVALYKYHCLQIKASEVYDEITAGQINDPETAPDEILAIVDEIEEDLLDQLGNEYYSEGVKDARAFGPN